MKALSEKTRQIIQKMFPAKQHEEVGQLLANGCDNTSMGLPNNDDYEQLLERIRFAVLRLSRGHLDALPLLITQKDWRDTLMGAGFANSVTEHEIWADEYLAASHEPPEKDPLNEPLEAVIYQENWVKCPHCGIRFSLNSLGSWSGERHRSCGQRLKFKTS